MADEMQTVEAQPTKHLVKFAKPYDFEGTEYTELDLSGLDSLTIQDAIDAQRQLMDSGETAAMQFCENTAVFACAIAVKVTKLPIEFFKLMPCRTMKMIRLEIRNAMNKKLNSKGSVMKFYSPYEFQGRVYNEIDLSGVADINTLQESAAENIMTVEGFPLVENSFNFLYACIIAGMGTKMPTEFFTGLPLCELAKLKRAVNN